MGIRFCFTPIMFMTNRIGLKAGTKVKNDYGDFERKHKIEIGDVIPTTLHQSSKTGIQVYLKWVTFQSQSSFIFDRELKNLLIPCTYNHECCLIRKLTHCCCCCCRCRCRCRCCCCCCCCCCFVVVITGAVFGCSQLPIEKLTEEYQNWKAMPTLSPWYRIRWNSQ